MAIEPFELHDNLKLAGGIAASGRGMLCSARFTACDGRTPEACMTPDRFRRCKAG
jgi:hypothetical protein